jgi:hypothetical protein
LQGKNLNILILGIGQLNFIGPIVKQIRHAFPFSKVGIKIKHPRGSGFESIFDNIYHPTNNSPLLFPLILCTTLLNRFVARFILISLLTDRAKSAFGHLKGFARSRHFMKSIGKKYDFVHVHFVSLKHLYEIPFIRKDARLIVSFWGSDLLRNSALMNAILVHYSLSRANIITVQSVELKEIIQVKYGRHLAPKIKVIKFILDETIFKEIDRMGSYPGLSPYCMPDKLNILVGHNASRDNNHIEILRQFLDVPLETRRNINFIFVFGYGMTNKEQLAKYRDAIAALCDELESHFVFINEYLNSEQVALLRFSCPIVIHMPVSDALSAAITESLYSNAVLVTGAWLPYGPMRRAGLQYIEVEDFQDFKRRLGDILANYDRYRKDCVDHKRRIRDHFLSETINESWADVYRF